MLGSMQQKHLIPEKKANKQGELYDCPSFLTRKLQNKGQSRNAKQTRNLVEQKVRSKGKGDQEALRCGTEPPREKRCLREGVLNIFTRGLLESLAEYQPFHVQSETSQTVKSQGKRHYWRSVTQIMLRDYTELDTIRELWETTC